MAASRRRPAITLTRLAERASAVADLPRADRLLRRAVVLAERLGDRDRLVTCLQGLAPLAQVEGNLQRAARLLGAARSFCPGGHDEDDDVTRLREGLGEAEFLTAWMAGRGMEGGEAARYAAEGRD